jgi:hypothetical protein
VKHSGEFDLGRAGQTAGVNRHPDSLLILVQNTLLIKVTMQSFFTLLSILEGTSVAHLNILVLVLTSLTLITLN